MIQRIQSIFLLLAVLANLAVMMLPVWQSNLGTETGMINALAFDAEGTANDLQFFEHVDGASKAMHIGFFSLVLASSLLLLFSIFKFNDRPAQMRLCYIGIILVFLEILAVVLLAQSGASAAPQPAFALPVLAVLFSWLAARYIKKDDDLVNDSDRIR